MSEIVETLSPLASHNRFEEVKNKDIIERLDFMVKYNANSTAASQNIKTAIAEMQLVWKQGMEKLVTKPADHQWLEFLVIELAGYSLRVVNSFDRWIANETERTRTNILIDDEKTSKYYYKKFTQGLQTSQRLETLIAERAAVKERSFEGYLKNQLRAQHGTLEEFRLSVPEVAATFARIFRKVIS